MHDKILILDFGSQVTQLIARRVREAHVYCEIHPNDVSDAFIREFAPKGIILSGSHASTYEEHDLRAPAAVWGAGVPVLGICYGMFTMAVQQGGQVEASTQREFGYAEVRARGHTKLLDGIQDFATPEGHGMLKVWMSHGDKVTALPPGFKLMASTPSCPIAGMADEARGYYGVQFHPEVTHTAQGRALLDRFVLGICGARPDWVMRDHVAEAVASIRAQVGDEEVILGLSGGVDSAITAAVAADALGPDRVHAIMMPSPYTSHESLEDAESCAKAVGVRYDIVDIGPAMEAFRGMLAPLFGNRPEDVTEENIQSRARGVTLMAVSNKLGGMVVTTGNKSEMAVGYATLYGDMCGGFNVLKDVYKTTVFELCRWRNGHLSIGALGRAGMVIPSRIIDKPPSAELRPDQKDSDSLPPYPILDAILKGLIERDLDTSALAREGHDPAIVDRVWRLLEGAEYKRRQAPPGVKITSRSVSRERRYPIVNGFRGRQEEARHER